jgi:hypothetical protein
MMLAAVETVTKADPVWAPRRHNPDVAAQATARESVHAGSPLKSSGRIVYNEPRRARYHLDLAEIDSKTLADCVVIAVPDRSCDLPPDTGEIMANPVAREALRMLPR